MADLPWAAKRAEFRLTLRRFRCANPVCRRLTFTERLAPFASYARRTNRMTKTLAQLGLELGGKAGARVAKGLGMPTSHDTILRIIMKSESDYHHRAEGAEPPLRVVGVDEWAVKRGHRYGTTVVDLERRRPVAVLVDREVTTVANWLEQHPTIEIVSRDRSGGYAQAANRGAPQAHQVADKFHLLKNLSEAVEQFLHTKRAWLGGASVGLASLNPPLPLSATQPLLDAKDLVTPELEIGILALDAAGSRRKQATLKTHQQRYQLVRDLKAQKVSNREIGLRLGLGHTTVWRYLQMSEPPKAKPLARHAHHILDPYEPYVLRRYNEGCRQVDELLAELHSQGAKVSRTTLWRFFTELNRTNSTATNSLKKRSYKTGLQLSRAEIQKRRLAPRNLALLFVARPYRLQVWQKDYLTELGQLDSTFALTYDQVQAFASLVRERRGNELGQWIAEIEKNGVIELQRFARGLKKDYKAVVAGLSLEWSQGQTEGQVNRLKLLKRQMYGRAGVRLLEKRVLHRAA